jgi:8-oxo-dGTP pyrophosphatase MutT (NUDIX family)
MESPKPFCISIQEHLQNNAEIDSVSVGALVFFKSTEQLLILQRAAHDTFPSLWEIPGGKCDHLDASMLDNLLRELYEETGLQGVNVGPCVSPGEDGPDYKVFGDEGRRGYKFSWGGKRVVKYTFLVTVENMQDVRLDKREHQAFMWISEEECKAGCSGDAEIAFTTLAQRETIMQGFKTHRLLSATKV